MSHSPTANQGRAECHSGKVTLHYKHSGSLAFPAHCVFEFVCAMVGGMLCGVTSLLLLIYC